MSTFTRLPPVDPLGVSPRALAAIDAAEEDVSRGQVPEGRLRVNSFATFALQHLAPALPSFMDPFEAAELLSAGEVDWWQEPPLDFIPKIKQNPNIETPFSIRSVDRAG